MVSDARKYDVSENKNRYRLNGIGYLMRKDMSSRKCHRGLDVRKLCSLKTCTFTVCGVSYLKCDLFL